MPGKELNNDIKPNVKLKYRLCTSCGNYCHIDEDQKFCIVCGEKMIEECPGCKEPIIYPNAKHCHRCGSQYQFPPEVDQPPADKIQNEK